MGMHDGHLYRRIVKVSSIVIAIPALLVKSIGVILMRDPHSFITMEVTKKVYEKHKMCGYDGIHVCQMPLHGLQHFPYGDTLNPYGWAIICCGSTIQLSSIFGIIGASLQKKSLLYIMILFACLSVALEFTAMDVLESERHPFHDHVKRRMYSLRGKYEITRRNDNEFTKGFDLIMMSFDCCGFGSATDFDEDYSVVDNSGNVHNVSYPPSCCDFSKLKRQVDTFTSTQRKWTKIIQNELLHRGDVGLRGQRDGGGSISATTTTTNINDDGGSDSSSKQSRRTDNSGDRGVKSNSGKGKDSGKNELEKNINKSGTRSNANSNRSSIPMTKLKDADTEIDRYRFKMLMECQSSNIMEDSGRNVSQPVRRQPCFSVIHAYFNQLHGNEIISVLMATIYYQVIQVIFALMAIVTLGQEKEIVEQPLLAVERKRRATMSVRQFDSPRSFPRKSFRHSMLLEESGAQSEAADSTAVATVTTDTTSSFITIWQQYVLSWSSRQRPEVRGSQSFFPIKIEEKT